MPQAEKVPKRLALNGLPPITVANFPRDLLILPCRLKWQAAWWFEWVIR